MQLLARQAHGDGDECDCEDDLHVELKLYSSAFELRGPLAADSRSVPHKLRFVSGEDEALHPWIIPPLCSSQQARPEWLRLPRAVQQVKRACARCIRAVCEMRT